MSDTPLTNRQIDALIAEKVMGWTLDSNIEETNVYWVDSEGNIMGWPDGVEQWAPSAYIGDAWQVLEKFETNDDIFLRTEVKGWTCNIETDEGGYIGYGDTAPMAICVAALKAAQVMP